MTGRAPRPVAGKLASAIDRAMVPVARRLDADKMATLGIRNTMRLAKLYNGALYGRYQRSRAEHYRRHRDRTLGEGAVGHGGLRLGDGFALDSSMSLPHLDRVLREGDEVIRDRGGSPPVDDRYRAFFRNLVSVDDLERWPSFLDFITSPPVVSAVAEYLGFIPALSETLPQGVRVVESGKHLDALAHLPPRDSQVFHMDPYDHPMVYVIVLLRDCGPENGPFTFLPASVSARAARELRYWSRGRPYRLGDEEIYSVVDPGDRIELAYPRGTVLFVDTSRCFHYGARDGTVPRFQLMYGLTSVCRADFSETYMAASRHPLPPETGGLRRLVLDRRAHAA